MTGPTVWFRLPFCPDMDLMSSQVNDAGNKSFFVINNFINNGNSSVEGLLSGEGPTPSSMETTPSGSYPLALWFFLTDNCRLATIIVGGVGGALVILGLIFNILLIAASFAIKPKPLTRKSDTIAVRKQNFFKDSIFVSVLIINLSIFSVDNENFTIMNESCQTLQFTSC